MDAHLLDEVRVAQREPPVVCRFDVHDEAGHGVPGAVFLEERLELAHRGWGDARHDAMWAAKAR